jgi:hypothetical protein
MLKTVRKYLADYKPGRAFSHDIAREPPVLGPRTVVATFPGLGQARLNLAFPSVKDRSRICMRWICWRKCSAGGEFDPCRRIRDQDSSCAAPSNAMTTRHRMHRVVRYRIAARRRPCRRRRRRRFCGGHREDQGQRRGRRSSCPRQGADEDRASEGDADLAGCGRRAGVGLSLHGDDPFQRSIRERIEQVTAEQVHDAAKNISIRASC